MKVLCVQVCALICVLAATSPAAEDWLWDFDSPTLPENMILASGTLAGSESPSLSYSLEGGTLSLADPEPSANGGAFWAIGAHSEILADALIQGQVQSETNNIGLGARSLGPGSGYIFTLVHPDGDPTRAAAALAKAGAEQPILAATEPVLTGFDQPFFLELSTVGQAPVQLNGRVFRHQGGPELLTVSAVDDGSDGVGPFAAGNAGFVADTIGLPPSSGHIEATFDNISAVSAGIDSVVVPAGLEQKDGNTFFGRSSSPPAGARSQEVYSSSDFSSLPQGPAVLVSMAFRPDRTANSHRTVSLPDLEVRLSTTDAAPGSLSQSFASNVGSDETLVYAGDIRLTTDGSGGASDGLNEFDYVVNFQTPFVYDPSQGNLLVDWNYGRGATGIPLFDGHNSGPIQIEMAPSPTATWAPYQFNGVSVKRFEFLAAMSILGDFDGDGLLTTADIDALTAEIADGTDDSAFDLSGDSVVDQADLTTWLADAAEHKGLGQAYLSGDSNLDGVVDSEDLNSLALNWRQEVAEWSGGDFAADGVVNSADLNKLALNWRQSIPIASSASTPLPEPSAWFLTVVGLALTWRRPRCS